jgi:D-alanine transaminase
MIVYLNGQFVASDQAKISVFDRGFLVADSVYEVIAVYRGALFQPERHLDRLKQGLNALKIDCHFTYPQWINIFEQLISKNNATTETYSIYLQITRGAGKDRNYGIPEKALTPTIFAFISENKAINITEDETGFKVITHDDLRWKWCHLKTTQLLPNILLSDLAKQSGAAEVILIRNENALEGANSNFFIVKNGVLITPPPSDEMLSGTTRQLILDLAARLHIPVKERTVLKNELYTADELWITSAVRGVMPIIQCDNQLIGNGKPGLLWKKIHATFMKDI